MFTALRSRIRSLISKFRECQLHFSHNQKRLIILMDNAIINYIREYSGADLAPEETELINSSFQIMKFKKREYLLRAGEINRYFGFIVSGAMRQYYVCDKGSEHTVKLGIENWWVGDMESFTSKKTSSYNIEAREHTELFTITFPSFVQLVKKSPAFALTLLAMEERNAISTQFRLNAYISLSAEQRYSAFLGRYSALFHRFPSHIIASFVGIQKETLSRVKKSSDKRQFNHHEYNGLAVQLDS